MVSFPLRLCLARYRLSIDELAFANEVSQSMWFITYGFRSFLLTIGSGMFNCPKTRNMQGFRHRRYRRFFVIYGIPLLPLENGREYVKCNHCGEEFKPDVLQLPDANVTYKHHHPYLRVFAIFGAVIFLFISCYVIAALTTAR